MTPTLSGTEALECAERATGTAKERGTVPDSKDDPNVLYLSTTGFGEASNCLQKFNYHQNLHLVPKPNNISAALRRGIWIHSCIEQYHKHGDWFAALDGLCSWALEQGIDDDQIDDRRKETERIMLGYTGYYRDAPKWKVLGSELHLEWDTGATMPDGRRVVLGCTLDTIVEDPTYGCVIVEHKSTGDIPPPSWRVVDPQTALQVFLAEKNGFKVDGVVFNYLLTREPTVPRVKQNGDFYADALNGQTSSGAFYRAADELRRVWHNLDMKRDEPKFKPDTESQWYQDEGVTEPYLERCRAQMVNDGKYYQRFAILKPKGNINEALKDVMNTIAAIKQAEKSKHWRRSYHTINCRRFCFYSDVCMSEMARGGRPNMVLRESDYIIDEGLREGDDAWLKYGQFLGEDE